MMNYEHHCSIVTKPIGVVVIVVIGKNKMQIGT